jgi:chromosome condensin MukBEF complex kleisin-like MukF subunit
MLSLSVSEMTEVHQNQHLRAAYEVATQRRDLHLEPRDVAIVILLQHELNAGSTQTFSVSTESLRALSIKIDTIDGSPSVGSELRCTGSLSRLLKAEVLARADMARIRNAEDTQYQLTSVGEALATWHVQLGKFDGEPLGAILGAFNVQLSGIHAHAESAKDEKAWQEGVSLPIQYVIRELLSAVQRHQRELDRQHEEFRNFVPTLLKESSETSIDRCKDVLDAVMKTIQDLVHVTVNVSNAAFGLLAHIEQAGEDQGRPNMAELCEDVRRRLESITEWTNDRHKAWGTHFDTVHSYLRFMAHVDHNRKVTNSLKQAIAVVPDWTLEVVDCPRLPVLRERAASLSERPVLKRKRRDHEIDSETIAPDLFPQRLAEIVNGQLLSGSASWAKAIEMSLKEQPTLKVIAKLPELMNYMITAGDLNRENRTVIEVMPGFVIEELEVSKR